MRKGDYYDEKLLNAPLRAAEVLEKHLGEWSDEVEAYWLLRRHEDEVGVPVTYDIVEAAIAILRSRGVVARRVEAEAPL
ncbi:MAG: hypothetical protein GXO09_01350 [Crenarchaeota archaeon]|nr:hypothetical protein [Thermoproteota archaeon]